MRLDDMKIIWLIWLALVIATVAIFYAMITFDILPMFPEELRIEYRG